MQEKYLTFSKYFSRFVTNTFKYFQERSLVDIYEKVSFLSFVVFVVLGFCSRHDFSHYYIPARDIYIL